MHFRQQQPCKTDVSRQLNIRYDRQKDKNTDLLMAAENLHANLLQKDHGEPHSTEVFQRTLLKDSSKIAISSTYDMCQNN